MEVEVKVEVEVEVEVVVVVEVEVEMEMELRFFDCLCCTHLLPQREFGCVNLRSLTTFLLLLAQAECNLLGPLLLQELSEHRNSNSSAFLHTFYRDVCALMAMDCSSSGRQPADCAAVHGASSALQAAFGARLRVV